MTKRIKIILIVSAVVLVAGGIGFYFYWKNAQSAKVHYSTIELKRGNITYGITATGNLNDSLVINVGTQVSGIISQIFVDFNDSVKAGRVIAMIDTIPLATEVTNAEAALFKTKTSLLQQNKEFGRYKELLARKAVNQSDYDLQEANYNVALSAFQSAQADLKRARTNLGYATIRAPISGIIISRNVTVGQTVASSFNTPTLFAIGNDPHIMQVTASIDEADIGWLKQGQDVDFTVETYPDRVYTGKVFQVRLQPITNQNVVSYNVMINVYNKDLSLLPGMTATLTVKVVEHKNVLVVPMTALLFNPNVGDTSIPSADHNKQTIWVMCDSISKTAKDSKCVNIKGVFMYCDTVRRILDDGVMAEIEGTDIHEGMKIVTGIKKEAAKKTKSLLPNTTQQRPRGMGR
jgi:HlyD family secretion protein